MASRLLVNRDIKLRKNPGDDAETVGFFLSVVLLNFDSSSALLFMGTTDGVEKIYDVLLLKPGFDFDFDFDGISINYAIKKIWTRLFPLSFHSSSLFSACNSAFGGIRGIRGTHRSGSFKFWLWQSHHLTPLTNRWRNRLSFPMFNIRSWRRHIVPYFFGSFVSLS